MVRLDRKRKKRTSNKDWKSPADEAAAAGAGFLIEERVVDSTSEVPVGSQRH
jgi:hypothetical protein